MSSTASRPAFLSLIGYRCTGKTTVGRHLARLLEYEFADSDELVRQTKGCEIADIFAKDGEAAFRESEEQAIALLTQKSKLVLSVGGGAVTRAANVDLLRRAGPVCWLVASQAEIVRRMQDDAQTEAQRPALTGGDAQSEVTELLRRREPLYSAAADFQVATDGKTPEAIALEIYRQITPGGSTC